MQDMWYRNMFCAYHRWLKIQIIQKPVTDIFLDKQAGRAGSYWISYLATCIHQTWYCVLHWTPPDRHSCSRTGRGNMKWKWIPKIFLFFFFCPPAPPPLGGGGGERDEPHRSVTGSVTVCPLPPPPLGTLLVSIYLRYWCQYIFSNKPIIFFAKLYLELCKERDEPFESWAFCSLIILELFWNVLSIASAKSWISFDSFPFFVNAAEYSLADSPAVRNIHSFIMPEEGSF